MKEGSGTFIELSTWVIGFSVNFFSVRVNFASHLPPSVTEKYFHGKTSKTSERTSKHPSHVGTPLGATSDYEVTSTFGNVTPFLKR